MQTSANARSCSILKRIDLVVKSFHFNSSWQCSCSTLCVPSCSDPPPFCQCLFTGHFLFLCHRFCKQRQITMPFDSDGATIW